MLLVLLYAGREGPSRLQARLEECPYKVEESVALGTPGVSWCVVCGIARAL